MKITGRRIVLLVGVLLISVMFLSSIYLKNSNEKEVSESIARIKGQSNLSEYPRIVNVAPSSIGVGEAYNFSPLVSVSETLKSKLIYEMSEGPSWLFFDEDMLFGIPNSTDIGDSRVVIRVWNGSVYSDYIFYVNVYEQL
jgi:hypothetical protein